MVDLLRDKLLNVNYGDTSKEIHITCPGPHSPILQIKDLVDEGESVDSNIDGDVEKSSKCLYLSIKGQNFDLKLQIDCQE